MDKVLQEMDMMLKNRIVAVLRMFFQLLDDSSIQAAAHLEMMLQLHLGPDEARAYFMELREPLFRGYTSCDALDRDMDDDRILKHGVVVAPSIVLLARFVGNSEVFKAYPQPGEENQDSAYIPDPEVLRTLMLAYREVQYV